MSNRLRRKSRAQADVEIYGGPLKQKSFKGGMNLDRPASEIGEDQVASATNVICFERHIEGRPGTKKVTGFGFTMPGSGTYHNFVSNQFAKTDDDFSLGAKQYILHRGDELFHVWGPVLSSSWTYIQFMDYNNANGVDFGEDTDSTIRPFRNGHAIFSGDKIAYLSNQTGLIQINAPNPVHGVASNSSGGTTYIRRYLVTLSRIRNAAGTVVANRESAGAILEHESGTNGAYYYDSGTQSRATDYGEVSKSTAWGPGAGYQIPLADSRSIFASSGSGTDDAAGAHFTHYSVYATLDLGVNGRDPETQQANPRNLYVWVGDQRRDTVIAGTESLLDDVSDDTLRNRAAAKNYLLSTWGFQPLPGGSCGEATPSFLFVCDRGSDSKPGTVYYSQIDGTPQHMGYYFPDAQFKDFGDPVVAIRATGDILSVFGMNSTHTCTLTSWTEIGASQSVIVLNHFTTVDETLGVRDWGTIAQVDRSTLIAVCSDASVRLWDTTKWGADLSYDAVNSEIKQIVPASTDAASTGSLGIFFQGVYHLWYSKNSSDTALTNHLRYGFGGRAGYGWTFEDGIELPFRCGATIAVDATNRLQRLIAISSNTANGHRANDVYWLDTYDAFAGSSELGAALGRTSLDGLGQADAGSYAGSEIACSVKFREMTANEEADTILHRETHAYFRPLSEAAGYRSGFEVSLSGYVDGAVSASETISDLPKTGDWHFTEEMSGRRIQLQIATTTTQFRLVGLDSHCRSLDRINYATAGDNVTSESTTGSAHHQKSLASNLTHWATRRQMSLDRATATPFTLTGTSVSSADGPDGKAGSAYIFNNATYSVSASRAYNNFSVLFGVQFISTVPTGSNIVAIALGGSGIAALTISLTSATQLNVSGIGNVTINGVSAGAWHHFAIVRSITTISVYQNGVLMGTLSSANSLGGGAMTFGRASGTSYMHDLRVYSSALSADEISYLYNDITSNAGAITLPMV